ncbi:MAG TPA: hypothetical protein VFG05_04930 [Methylocella sp.]|nr:hypothetical protein [Methylocella sp.]
MTEEQEWRCRHYGKLLGIVRGRRVHLHFARGHEYLVGFPATATCRGCRTLNEISAAPEPAAVREAANL